MIDNNYSEIIKYLFCNQNWHAIAHKYPDENTYIDDIEDLNAQQKELLKDIINE